MALEKFIKDFSGLTEEYKFYNGEVTLRYEPENHIYYLLTEDNQFIPQAGVTTVCHIVDKSNALIPWACKMMADKLLRTVPTYTIPETSSGFPSGTIVVPETSFEEFTNLVLESKSAHKEKLEEAADIGSMAHNWIEQYIKAILNVDQTKVNQISVASLPLPEDEKAKSCCNAALDWMQKHNVRWISTERKIYSRTWQYAGTMDGFAIVDSCNDPLCCPHQYKDRKAVIDWKSSNYLYIEYLFQTAAYMNAYAEEIGELADERWIIRLGKVDGQFEAWHLENETYEADLSGYLNCLKLYRSVAHVEERMKIQKNFIKDSLKKKKQQEKEAQLLIKCKNADKYKGTRKPTCNSGNPCKTCLEIYERVQAEKALTKQLKAGNVSEDLNTTKEE